jgi:hypothetical protein
LRCLDSALFKPIPPSLQAVWPLLKAIYWQTKPREPKEPEKTAPAPKPASEFMTAAEVTKSEKVVVYLL